MATRTYDTLVFPPDMITLKPTEHTTEILANTLDVSDLEFLKSVTGGNISNSWEFWSQNKQKKYFVKYNTSEKAKEMFAGESESIKAIESTNTINIAPLLQLVDFPVNGVGMVMEHIDLCTLNTGNAVVLGEQIARLHLYNSEMKNKFKKAERYVGQAFNYRFVEKFGFHTNTYHGYHQQDTTWTDDWPTFYARKLNSHVRLLEKTRYHTKEVSELWSELASKIPLFFTEINVVPSLLHGDLWYGNIAGVKDGGPIVYDPASFYGHAEYDIVHAMSSGLHQSLFDAYFNLIPKDTGFERRRLLYELYRSINMWIQLGEQFRSATLERVDQLKLGI